MPQPLSHLLHRTTPAIVGAMLLHALWWLASLWLSSPILPTPLAVYAHLPEVLTSGEALSHLSASLGRVLMGIAISLGIALVLALWMFARPRVGQAFSSIIYLSYPIPKLALLPIVMLLAGLGETTKVVMIILIILFQMVVGLSDSLRHIPQSDMLIMQSLGASFAQRLRHMLLPSILPELFSSLRIAIGTAISILFVTETYGTALGMGYYIVDAWMRIHYMDMYVGIVLLSLMGFVLFVLMDALEYLCCPWQRRANRRL